MRAFLCHVIRQSELTTVFLSWFEYSLENESQPQILDTLYLNSGQIRLLFGTSVNHKHLGSSINKAKKTFHAINLIKKYFNQEELKGLLTSNYFSVLYYNSEIWHLPTLSPLLKQKLLSASANAVKLCLSKLPLNTSYEAIHRLAKMATPSQMSNYKHALQLHKLYNSTNMSDDWLNLNLQQNFNGRNEMIQFFNMSNYKVGRNLLVNRFRSLNNKIKLTWLNDSYESYKIKCKNLLL